MADSTRKFRGISTAEHGYYENSALEFSMEIGTEGRGQSPLAQSVSAQSESDAKAIEREAVMEVSREGRRALAKGNAGIKEEAATKERAPGGLMSEIRFIDVDAILRILACLPPAEYFQSQDCSIATWSSRPRCSFLREYHVFFLFAKARRPKPD